MCYRAPDMPAGTRHSVEMTRVRSWLRGLFRVEHTPNAECPVSGDDDRVVVKTAWRRSTALFASEVVHGAVTRTLVPLRRGAEGNSAAKVRAALVEGRVQRACPAVAGRHTRRPPCRSALADTA